MWPPSLLVTLQPNTTYRIVLDLKTWSKDKQQHSVSGNIQIRKVLRSRTFKKSLTQIRSKEIESAVKASLGRDQRRFRSEHTWRTNILSCPRQPITTIRRPAPRDSNSRVILHSRAFKEFQKSFQLGASQSQDAFSILRQWSKITIKATVKWALAKDLWIKCQHATFLETSRWAHKIPWRQYPSSLPWIWGPSMKVWISRLVIDKQSIQITA